MFRFAPRHSKCPSLLAWSDVHGIFGGTSILLLWFWVRRHVFGATDERHGGGTYTVPADGADWNGFTFGVHYIISLKVNFFNLKFKWKEILVNIYIFAKTCIKHQGRRSNLRQKWGQIKTDSWLASILLSGCKLASLDKTAKSTNIQSWTSN